MRNPDGTYKICTFRGIEIYYSETHSEFSAQEVEDCESKTLAGCKAKIRAKQKTVLSKTPVLCTTFGFFSDFYKPVLVIVTSFVDDNQAWVHRNGRREKVNAKSLYSNTPQNRKFFAALKRLEKEYEKKCAVIEAQYEKRKNALEKKLKRFTKGATD